MHKSIDSTRRRASQQRHLVGRQALRVEHAGTDRVVDVVVDVRDAVDELHDPSLERGGRGRSRVVQDAVPDLVRQIQPAAVALQVLDDTQRVLVVAEPTPRRGLERVGQRLLAGVAERRVSEVVAERDRLGQVLVQLQRARHRARDPDHLERVGQPRAVVVALRRDEDLRLVLEAPERLGVDDAVAVALERRAQRALLLRPRPGHACRRSAPPRGASRRSSSARMRSSKRAATGPSPSGITPPRAPSGAGARRT